MLCPKCNGKSSVVDSRTRNKTTWRKRYCPKCKYNYRTLEVLEPPKSKEPPKLKLVKPKKKRLKSKVEKPKVWNQLEAVRTLTDEELEEAIMSGQVVFDEDEI